MGWWLDESNIAQVSINLTDHDVTPIHIAYEEVNLKYLLNFKINILKHML